MRKDSSRSIAAVVGVSALMTMAAVTLQSGAHIPDTAGLVGSGPMQTGVTSTESTAAAASPATPAASPTLRATPEWGQPSEP